MKKFKFLLVILVAMLIVPFSVFADEDKKDAAEDTKVQEVKLYFFHGDGCGFCSKASAWFEEIEDEYGDKFEVVAYEVWNSAENSELMEEVAKVRKETANGVPYIIIGNQSWNGFDDSYKEAILSKIESEYERDPEERYDVMNYIGLEDDEDNTTRDVLVLLVLVGVVAAVSIGVVVARKNTN